MQSLFIKNLLTLLPDCSQLRKMSPAINSCLGYCYTNQTIYFVKQTKELIYFFFFLKDYFQSEIIFMIRDSVFTNLNSVYSQQETQLNADKSPQI